MNIEEVKRAMAVLNEYCDPHKDSWGAQETLELFIDEVEALLKHNSIKQVPALFKEKK